ncbi:MAG TPA: DUF2243 domain-containing protein [Methylophilaceae bacterium]|nr:DUF2243 domain-containing protein [Methylophilaceae bacterium]
MRDSLISKPRRGPLVTAGLFLGIGLGGFVDGILFHQILQIHNMLSARIPVADLVSAKINMTWDGYFHAGVWVMTLLGVWLLFRAGTQRNTIWSGKMLSGAMLFGWGLFNLVEGLIDHQILGIHHVMEYAINKFPYDLAFLISSLILMLAGWALIRAPGRDSPYSPVQP